MTKMFDVRTSEPFHRLLDTEKTAESIFYNSPLHIPGLLQEPSYAQEMICGISGLAPADPEAIERVRVRNERHAHLLQRLELGDAPRLQVVLDESVLRRGPVGSTTKRRQIEHLIEVSRRPTVRVGVMPLEHGPHPGLAGSFELHDSANGSLVFFEGAEGDRILDDVDRVAMYRELANSLMDIAVSGEQARALMSKLLGG
ncbi:DUF5753 domain-containing protein [Couchioplanes caeruleus]|uniref:DUF5753 domain-containing protein n=1 Tax=Couchioplanes caeruleus TaxID=56438 RepID=UPI0020BEC8DA|nr:DUF5753 domain-containing protein [Couchioplanes caeruleus]UQU65718.1 DUF5753 domain-containing protein [Couchioplanes caeruleus]